MAEKEKASLAFPMTCILISFAFTSYLHRTWISQQFRTCKRLIRRVSRKTQRQIHRWIQQLHKITNNRGDGNEEGTYNALEPSTRGSDHLGLRAYSANGHSRWDSDNTSTASSSHLDEDEDSDISSTEEPSPLHSLRPTWILDSTGQYVLNRAPEPLQRATWEIDLDERIRNDRGLGAWLDRMIEWVVHRIVANFDAEMRGEIERANVDRRGVRS
ncbi:uncharacterized protein N7496_004325 [Penicillium cataractarum]|uniref:Uncharacterized protein n=1 Tax=Penicillium cataractarum TaxID=2100454 RepID=A0A9W9VHA1_9EURO|nr:uncharacterized protein N7496_004325 [Penicillium cataractarum]KAJ5381897.1 hypothetical protein N7496_004325 [Penicillium cataractarum]